MAAIEIRRVGAEEDARASLRIWNTVYDVMPASEADLESYAASCIARADHVALLDGEPVGSADVAIELDAATPDVAMAHVAVLPHARRRGAGDALYGAVSAWARERGRSLLETWVLDAELAGPEFAAARGFEEVFRDVLVALDLTGLEPPQAVPPPGVRIVTWAERPDLARGMYEVMREAAPDIPGNEAPTPAYDDWLRHYMTAASDRADATFVALAGKEVVAYAKLHLSAARPAVAVHDLTGVKGAWRGRGVARALKATQIAWAIRHGYERLETANELRNAPIRRLNDEFGYAPIPGRALVRGPALAR